MPYDVRAMMNGPNVPYDKDVPPPMMRKRPKKNKDYRSPDSDSSQSAAQSAKMALMQHLQRKKEKSKEVQEMVARNNEKSQVVSHKMRTG